MHQYVIRRSLQAIPTLFGITVIVYFLMLLAPGDPVALLAFDPKFRQDERERLAAQLGVDDSFFVQYVRWLIGDDWMMVDTNLDGEVDSWGDNYGILRGDFGTSFKFRGSNPLNLIAERLGATIELNLFVLIFGLTSGLAIGVLAAAYRGRIFDRFTRIFAVLGVSIPVFFLGCWQSSTLESNSRDSWKDLVSALAGRSCQWGDAARRCGAAARLSTNAFII